ncbi:hypothetical protein JR316_0008435 [Psilocybe cubensis]|uniref:Uncharacterized protein n=2 Tax=Psilocybe cubensis TaxID=181762 RepID=A0ACB8GY06_PSICU|nr:hypothetical protein JR316_0008435 [Psilocybe cubensis]KAH9479840.1 hypothetical protein JR316_0008435 [Psilocybe cubensis]
MNPETRTYRFPKPQYSGKNGFLSQFTDPAQITDKNEEEAIEKHRQFEFFLEHQKREVPDLETMAAELNRKDDAASLKKQIDDLQVLHENDLQRLYDFNVNEYLESIQSQHTSRDYTAQRPEVYEAERAAIDELFDMERRGLQIKWEDRYQQLHYAHLSEVLALTAEKKRIEEAEEKARQEEARAFPLTAADYNRKAPDMKLRVALFLTADKNRQERYLDEHGWAWRQVQPLCDVFKKDMQFAANVRALVINNAMAPKPAAPVAQKYTPTTDPRKRPPAA